jgi:hypothetical protein
MLPLAIIIAGAIAGLAVVVVAIINFRRIVAWFRSRQNLKQSDKDNIAFTIKTTLENGNYQVVKGIFNTEDEELLDGEKEQSEEIDEETERMHAGKEVVIYE